MDFKFLIAIYFLCFFSTGQVFANTQAVLSYPNLTNNSGNQSEIEVLDKYELLKVIDLQEATLVKLSDDYKKQSEDLKKLQDDYADLKHSLDVQLQTDELTSFSGWASVLLTTVAVIVTALGVLMAILGIFGYTNIGKQAQKAAEEAAENAIKTKLDQIAVEEFEKLLNGGRLIAPIHSAVATYLNNQRNNVNLNVYPELDEEFQNEG